MADVTAEIKRLMAEKNTTHAAGQKRVRGLLSEVKRQIVDELSAIRSETYSAQMLKANLSSIGRYLSAFESTATKEMEKLLDAAWDAGSDLVPSAMRTGGLFVAFGHIPGPLLTAMKDFAFHKISGLSADAFNKMRGELSLALLGQKTPHQVIQAIAGSLQDPGKFKNLEHRAETIAKTELGRAYSAGTVEGLTQASRSVPAMEKQWWHAGHPKVARQNHLALDGQHQPVKEPFVVGSLTIDYPRAPTAPVQEVINCG